MVTPREAKLLEGTNLEGWDIAVIVGYFVLVMAFGIWVSFCKNLSYGLNKNHLSN